MATIGGELVSVKPGFVVLELPFSEKITQQHGFVHAGILTTMLDSAAGYAAFSLMEPSASVLTIEFKTNLMAPAKGDRFRFEGKVVKPGRTTDRRGERNKNHDHVCDDDGCYGSRRDQGLTLDRQGRCLF